MTRILTTEERAAVARAYAEGKPVKDIAAEHGLHVARPTEIAKQMGVPLRVRHTRQAELRCKVGKSLKERLRMAAKRQNTIPDVIVREALAAYLGGPLL